MATKTKFSKGDKVNFKRNSTIKSSKKIPVISVVNMPDNSNSEQAYIIEHPNGFVPNAQRIEQFDLDANKTYLFVKESELS